MLHLATSRASCFGQLLARPAAHSAMPKANPIACGSAFFSTRHPGIATSSVGTKTIESPAPPHKTLATLSPKVVSHNGRFPDKDGNSVNGPRLRQFKDGSVAVETSCGKVIEMTRVDRVMAEKLKEESPPKSIPKGNRNQLRQLPKGHHLVKPIITCKKLAMAILHSHNVSQGLAPESALASLEQLPKVAGIANAQYISCDEANTRSVHAGRQPEWSGEIVPVTEIRAGTILIQVIADSLPMVKIGKSPVSFDSQAYRIAKAIFEGETVPLGNYSLFTAPDNPDEAAMLAAILDAWKQGCSHFMILQVIEPFHALVGTIKGQPVDHYVDHETGTIATRKLQGGVLQCNAVNTAAFHKHVRVLHVVQLYDRKDAAFLSKVANSGVKGGALVEEFLASPHNLETSFGAFGN